MPGESVVDQHLRFAKSGYEVDHNHDFGKVICSVEFNEHRIVRPIDFVVFLEYFHGVSADVACFIVRRHVIFSTEFM